MSVMLILMLRDLDQKTFSAALSIYSLTRFKQELHEDEPLFCEHRIGPRMDDLSIGIKERTLASVRELILSAETAMLADSLGRVHYSPRNVSANLPHGEHP